MLCSVLLPPRAQRSPAPQGRHRAVGLSRERFLVEGRACAVPMLEVCPGKYWRVPQHSQAQHREFVSNFATVNSAPEAVGPGNEAESQSVTTAWAQQLCGLAFV